MTTHQDPLSVAIVGGGIAGLTLTIALLKKCPRMRVTLYESASAFGEIGAGVGFQPVMVRTMNMIDPRVAAAFETCNKGNDEDYDPPLWFRMRVGDERKKGVELGEELFIIPARKGPRGGVHRAHFLDELVKLVPEGVAQFKKKVVDVVETDDGDALLSFADGSTAKHSVVLGCDGIKSRLRPIVLGGDTEAAKAVFTGKYAYRGVLSMKKAVEILGDSASDPQMFMGYHGHVLTFPIANGKMFNGMSPLNPPLSTINIG
ncbi:mannitol 1-phosphate dehydrogenase [Pyrenophora seminiperda CCB06]|uniref:Mannitol 1-phosphate dehydrogenase n=1 Tax=Pyrenophora seminiperda CCB06 TaxID=1302712 RepID=A0A3M7M224_9PLEO|nr:mannitol 1-phosphate dehydrogenase [Pyrenophora seminiperda CCB06]